MLFLDAFLGNMSNNLMVSVTQILIYVVIALAAIALILLVALLTMSFDLYLYIDEGKFVKIRRRGMTNVKVEDPAPREGYTFDGWYLDQDLTVPCGKVYRMPFGPGRLFAKWVDEEGNIAPVGPVKAVIPAEQPVAPVEEIAEEPVAPVEQIAEEPVAPAEEPAEEEAAEQEYEEPVDEEEEEVAEDGEGDEIDNALVTTVAGGKVFVQYRRSFTARLIQSDDTTKYYYNQLRNALLSVEGVKERVSWNYDSYNVGRRQFAKVNANRKSLIVYFALPPESIDEKYNYRDVSEKKRNTNVPVRYKITGSRSFAYAMELLEQQRELFELDVDPFEEELDIPYEERTPLIRRRLIRVYAKRETGESITEDELDEMIENGATVQDLSAYTVTDEVTVNEAESLINDSTAKQIIALADVKESSIAPGKRTFINLDTISANYHEGQRVDLVSLQAKGLVDKKATACKILARGKLDKSLTIEAADFSLAAIKMIVLTGGKVVKVRRV